MQLDDEAADNPDEFAPTHASSEAKRQYGYAHSHTLYGRILTLYDLLWKFLRHATTGVGSYVFIHASGDLR